MKRLMIAVVLTALALAGITAATAFGWHAEGVTVNAQCQEGTYALSASIQGSSDPGEYIKSITPSSLPGNTSGSQSVTVVIGWANSDETQTFNTSVYLKGDCATSTPPPPPCPNNPDGQPPNPPGGKDGNPGNDECIPDSPPPPLTIDTETSPTPPTETTPTETTPPETQPPATVPPPIVSKNPPLVTAPPKTHKPPHTSKPPPVCPVGKPFHGKCSVQGSG